MIVHDRLDDDQAYALELAQGFADRHVAHVVTCCQRVDRDALRELDLARDDSLPAALPDVSVLIIDSSSI